ncbi:hypothetical protein K2173_024119 [Erythroxylum novogranatense]|uniref:Defensin-like protein n=1 Tax=Erythroxylum novogranatense TaxID=1862640 RepID=A0AAV8UFJ3_9ROSI|nr:hypothetical protein K2173_024119 [Erythroxylum novogranatense]
MPQLPCDRLLSVILLLFVSVALMVHHGLAQEMCHEVIPGNGDCNVTTCQARCSSLIQLGTGVCTQAFTNRFICICNWECSS